MQANQALAVLEQIQVTLTDPEKRNVYDTGLGLSGLMGGLADPEAVLRNAAPLPNMAPPVFVPASGRPAPVQVKPQGPADGIPCPNCNTMNSRTDRYCAACRTLLTQHCLVCDLEMPWNAENCTKCGANQAEELAKIQQRARLVLVDVQKALDERRWRSAREMLFAFEDLGETPKQPSKVPLLGGKSEAVTAERLYPREFPEWKQAEFYMQRTQEVKDASIKNITKRVAIGYAGVAFVFGLIGLISSGSPFFSVVFGALMIGLVSGAVGGLVAYIYERTSGGTHTIGKETAMAVVGPWSVFAAAAGAIALFALAVAAAGSSSKSND